MYKQQVFGAVLFAEVYFLIYCSLLTTEETLLFPGMVVDECDKDIGEVHYFVSSGL